MTEIWVAFGVALLPWAALTFVRLKRFLHILQLEEYLTPQYLRWLRENPERYLDWRALFDAGFVVLAINASDGSERTLGAIVTGWFFLGLFSLPKRRPKSAERKPLVMTARARRIQVLGIIASISAVLVAILLAVQESAGLAIAAGIAASFVVTWASGYVLALANLALWPLEERTRRRFQRMASAKLSARRPRIIAITGSAGKTTTKELVAHLLSARYRVLKTPASFNTPLGIARTVNDSYDGQEFFVVEMGAYKRDEIERLCRLVGGTDVSVITTVNAQHLERFGSLEATAQAKFEIVQGLRRGGKAVLNFDVAAIRALAEDDPKLVRGTALRPAQDERVSEAQDERIEVISFGVEAEDVALLGSNVVETPAGIELDVTHGGETAHVVTQLLARHNAGNVLAAIGVGLTCGLELGYMAAAIQRFAPPEHRLQPVQLDNGVTMLDDAYNANPEGIIGALEVLGAYKPRRRVLVTSGLIEMGREKAAYHARIGRAAAQNTDVAVLVGPKQTADIKESMLAASFAADCLHVARNPEEARAVLARIGQPGDVILYSTDLPDQFDEFLVI